VTEISQIENKDEVRSICFAAALQNYFGIWCAGLKMKFLHSSNRIDKFQCNGDGHFL
jgi:hypothetical protein